MRKSISFKNGSDAMDPLTKMSKKSTWMNVTRDNASISRLDSNVEYDNDTEVDSVFERTLRDILNPSRLAALDAVDVSPIPYNTYSFFSYILSVKGRNLPMLVVPLISLFLWGLGWRLLFAFGKDNEQINNIQGYLADIDELVTPLLTPLSFLMTFRLGRAAVRYWDARASVGKMVEICRANIAVVSVGLLSPFRLRRRRVNRQPRNESDNDEPKKQTQECNDNKEESSSEHNMEEEYAMELLCEYARWLSVFPIAVKHFLRPTQHKWGDPDIRYKKRRFEIGPLLSDEDACQIINEYDDKDGKPTSDSSTSTRARDPPLVVLNRLHELAYDISHFKYSHDIAPMPQSSAIFYQEVMEQVNILFGTSGAMERIKGTPLPFVYAIHLRTFLMVYLSLWNMSSVARYDWLSLPFLFLLNWALLGIEAASVVCERPFDYNPNHLTLGKTCVIIARNIAQALRECI